MKISWVIADTAAIDPTVDLDRLKNIGPFWGGWRTWRSYGTDNVVCHTANEAKNLVSRQFHTKCNLHVPAALFGDLGRPKGIKLYQGEFHELVDHPDDIVSMHLAAANSDIVLLAGFDFSPKKSFSDKLSQHKWHNYKQYVLHIFRDNANIQWVALDHAPEVDKEIKTLPNLLFDTVSGVLTQF